MILGGIWHGANWGMFIWGAVHAIVLIFNRMLWWTFGKPDPNRPFLAKLPGGIATFIVVMEARIVFRAPDMAVSWSVFLGQFKQSFSVPNLTPLVLAVMAAATFGHIMPHSWYDRMVTWFIRVPVPARAVAMIVLALLVKEVATFEVQPFIYFQF